MQTLLGRHWHHLPAEEVVQLMETDLECGLDLFEVKHRQERFGPNVLTPRRGKSPLLRFLLQFNNPLIYILLAAAVITAVIKDPVDAGIILAVVLVNAVIGFVQEARAEKAIEALAQAMTAEAAALRSGQRLRLPAAELVPGDVVLLQAGDKVPADLRLIRSRDLRIAEASLTGESVPAEKATEGSLAPDTVLADRLNMAYASTLVTYGQGTGVVIATGDDTEVGRISQLISATQELETPLTRKMARFSRLVLYAILVLAGVTFLVGILRGQTAVETFTATVALAVGMIPEGLPAALTVTLAIGVSRMARRKAIIRKLPAVETLGSVTVICSDKTGTLTQNQMTVQQIVVNGACYEVTGTGYSPAGQILAGEHPVDLSAEPALAEVLLAGLLCNDGALIQGMPPTEGAAGGASQGTGWQAQGDPTEVALLVSARKGGMGDDGVAGLPRLDAIPFDSEHHYMATLHDAGAERPRPVYLKGAVEVLLERCSSALAASGETIPLDAGAIHRDAEEMAERGLRVLAFARGELPPAATSLGHEQVSAGLTYLGLQGMIDPPRLEAVQAVRACQEAGVRVKMITGDHALTAAAVARELGLAGPAEGGSGLPPVLTGRALAEMKDAELIEAAEGTAVFARVSPEQKLRLVEALQVRGHVVAMTGDGVNDGPALKQADVGIAMGVTGTEVAKESADMVLTDDNFATIEAAVEEGRSVFDNLTKIIAWTLPTNLGEGLIIVLAILIGAILPILPIHVLWINMATAGVLGVVLAVELAEADIMRRPPRDPRAPILTAELIERVVVVGLLILAGAFGLFAWELSVGAGDAEARTAAVNMVIVIEIFYLLNCRSLTRSMFQVGLLSNRWVPAGVIAMVLLQILFTYAPFMNRILYSAPIGIEAWGRILVFGLFSYGVIELEKWLRRRRQSARRTEA
jgi:Ca2+-transporting ATPase